LQFSLREGLSWSSFHIWQKAKYEKAGTESLTRSFYEGSRPN